MPVIIRTLVRCGFLALNRSARDTPGVSFVVLFPATHSGVRLALAHSVFISYRREDSAGFTRAVYDRLCDEFTEEQLFMDVDAIAPGVDFVDAIDAAIAQCDALVAIIGKQWLSIEGANGPRLSDPDDYVRVEISTALRRGIRVIPLLVNDAGMPTADQLPDNLKSLARRNAMQISTTRFAADVEFLVATLKTVIQAEVKPARTGMDKADYVHFLEQAMSGQRMVQRFHVALASVVVVVGLAAIGGAHLLSGVLIPTDQKWLVTLGGSFVSTLSAFPIREIVDRRTRLSALQFLLDGFNRLSDRPVNAADASTGPLTERFWKLMDASLGTQNA